MLLVRFAINAKFHLDSGGGGPESNLKLIPYLLQASLYVLNQTKQQSLYSELVENYLTDFDAASCATDVKEMVDTFSRMKSNLRRFYTLKINLLKGPLFITTAAMLTMDHAWWAEKRFKILEKLIIMNQNREKSDDSVAWDTYKKVFFFWFMIDRNGGWNKNNVYI